MSDGLCECGCGEPAPIAKTTDRLHGWVRGEPKRFINTHHCRVPKNRERMAALGRTYGGRPREHEHTRDDLRARWYGEPEDRGYATPCLMWQGNIMNTGYGELREADHRWLAHRWAYERENGPIVEGHHLHHLCGQRACINPDHLQPMTPSAHRLLHVQEQRKAQEMSFGDAVRKSMDSELLDNRDPEALPKGQYKVTIDGGSAFTSRAGDDYAKVVLVINEGPVEGRFEHFMGFGSAMQEQISGEALAAYGINWTEIDSVKDLDLAIGELVGTTAEIGVSWNDRGFLNINVHGSRRPAEKAAEASETTPVNAGADFAAAAAKGDEQESMDWMTS